MYEVAPVEVVQPSETEALPAVAVSVAGAAGTELAPEELELLLDDEDELDELELDDELLELEELDEELLLAARVVTLTAELFALIFPAAS